jgi:hypothetical protein
MSDNRTFHGFATAVVTVSLLLGNPTASLAASQRPDSDPREATATGEVFANEQIDLSDEIVQGTERWIVVLKNPTWWEQFASFLREGQLIDVLERGEGFVEQAGAEEIGGGKLSSYAIVVRATPEQVSEIMASDLVARVIPSREVQNISIVSRDVSDDSLLAPGAWGLDRLDQRSTSGDGTFHYGPSGAGVSVYVLDTGIDPGITNEFPPSRSQALSLSSFSGYEGISPVDCDSHGTHVSGTAAGENLGVASDARLIGIKLSGWYSQQYGYSPKDECGRFDNIDIYLGMVLAHGHWVNSNRPPAVMNLSIGFTPDPSNPNSVAVADSMDADVAWLVREGITVVAAAGNDGQDACLSVPARTPQAITVAATNSVDTRPFWSNFGSCVDIFAPGESIISVVPGGAMLLYDGTSMAAPHVTGLIAQYLETNRRASPATVRSAITSGALSGVVNSAGPGSPNLLANTMFMFQPTEVRSASVRRMSNHVLVSWSRPSTLPAGATFRVESSTGGRDWAAVSGCDSLPAGQLSCQHRDNVSWGEATSYRIQAQTLFGMETIASDWVGVDRRNNPLTITPYATPDMSGVAGVSASVIPGNGRLQVSWGDTLASSDVSRGNALRSIQVRAVPAEVRGPTRTCSLNTRNGLPAGCAITGLTNDRLYTIEMRAQNAAGWSSWETVTAVTSDRTPIPVAPDQVRSAQVRALANQVDIRWVKPANDGGAPPSYSVQYQVGDSGVWVNVTGCSGDGFTRTSCRHNDPTQLSWGETTSYRIVATNSQGSSDWVGVDRRNNPLTITPYATPDMSGFVNVVAVDVSSRTISAYWNDEEWASYTNGAPILQVQVRAVPSSSTPALLCTATLTGGTLPQSCVVNQLVDEAEYRLEMRARNLAGWSDWESVSDSIVVGADNVGPTIVSATPNSGTFVPGNVLNFEVVVTDTSRIATVYVAFQRVGTEQSFAPCGSLAFDRVDEEGNEVWVTDCTVASFWPMNSYELMVNASDIRGNWTQLKVPSESDEPLTFSLDTTKPEVVSITSSAESWEAGETVTFRAVIRDQSEVSFVQFGTHYASDNDRFFPVCGTGGSWGTPIGTLESVDNEGLQTWVAECQIHEEALNGQVKLVVSAADSAGNQLPWIGEAILLTMMPEYVVWVTGGQDDTLAPTISSLAITPQGQSFGSGDTVTFELIGSDDTGILFVSSSWLKPEGVGFSQNPCGPNWSKTGTTDSGEEIWQMTCTWGANVAAGQWSLEIGLVDLYSRFSERTSLSVSAQ